MYYDDSIYECLDYDKKRNQLLDDYVYANSEDEYKVSKSVDEDEIQNYEFEEIS